MLRECQIALWYTRSVPTPDEKLNFLSETSGESKRCKLLQNIFFHE